MDSVTQVVLGAAVGEAVLGKKVANKAPLWGAVCGTIPDLDILITPFVSEVQRLGIHRAFSHSILFSLLAAPLLGWMIKRIHPHGHASRQEWGWLAFAALITHILLDCFTVYGTQIFHPFSNYPVIWGSIFIIDPVYTIPLLLGVLTALFLKRNFRKRRVFNYLGLAISTAYLISTWVIKLNVENIFEDALGKNHIPFQRLFIAPTPLNSLLWMGVAEDEDELWVGLYSLLDNDRTIQFEHISKNRRLIAEYSNDPAIQRLLWFSRGYYTITEKDGRLYFNDVRFGRSDTWLTNHGSYIFMFKLIQNVDESQQKIEFTREDPSLDMDKKAFFRLLRRIAGYK